MSALLNLRSQKAGRAEGDRRLVNILLVEDDEDDYILVRDLLSEIESWKSELEWAATYEAALKAIQRNRYDVCLIDYRLGAHDGLELLRQVGESCSRVPMIFLTGQGGHEIDVEAMKAGAADYLAKEQIDAALLERSIRYAVERAKTLEALRQSEERFRAIVEASPIPMVTVRLSDGVILYANESISQIAGLPSEELIGRRILDFYDNPADRQVLLNMLKRDGYVRNYELLLKRTDGTPVWVIVSLQLMAFNSKPAVLVGLYDVTERKRTERELIRLERLHALGEMAAGVSHNLNNILIGVLGPAQVLQRKMGDPQLLQHVEGIITCARRARDLVQRLHRAVRGGKEEITHPVQVNRVVREAVQVAQPRWKDESEARGISVEMIVELEEGLPLFQATEGGVHDILVNLLFNAVDALPEGGTITVRTRAVDGGVDLTVSDTGIGMDEETCKRVFEPFFTTKADVGTGLGLATVYGTVSRWGGTIDLKSAPGKGTTFTIRFPAWTKSGTEEKERLEVRRVRRGRVLVVEDDTLVLNVLSQLLSKEHEVEMALSGQVALKKFAPGRYDIVMIDLGMPEVPGNQVAREIRQVDPSVVTVLITGWELEESDPRLSGFDFRLQKPFEDLEEVWDVVARAMKLHDTRIEREKISSKGTRFHVAR